MTEPAPSQVPPWWTDPTENVKALVEADRQHNKDLLAMESRHLREMLSAETRRLAEQAELRAAHGHELRRAETERIDAIRAVDVGAVQRAAEVQAAQAQAIATQVTVSAEDPANPGRRRRYRIAERYRSSDHGGDDRTGGSGRAAHGRHRGLAPRPVRGRRREDAGSRDPRGPRRDQAEPGPAHRLRPLADRRHQPGPAVCDEEMRLHLGRGWPGGTGARYRADGSAAGYLILFAGALILAALIILAGTAAG